MDRRFACIVGRGAPGQCIEANGGKRGEGRDNKRMGREEREGGERGREGRGGNLREGGSHSV